jgi:hypothetical protein
MIATQKYCNNKNITGKQKAITISSALLAAVITLPTSIEKFIGLVKSDPSLASLASFSAGVLGNIITSGALAYVMTAPTEAKASAQKPVTITENESSHEKQI